MLSWCLSCPRILVLDVLEKEIATFSANCEGDSPPPVSLSVLADAIAAGVDAALILAAPPRVRLARHQNRSARLVRTGRFFHLFLPLSNSKQELWVLRLRVSPSVASAVQE